MKNKIQFNPNRGLSLKEQQLQKRLERLEAAFVEAIRCLDAYSLGRAYEVLTEAIKPTTPPTKRTYLPF